MFSRWLYWKPELFHSSLTTPPPAPPPFKTPAEVQIYTCGTRRMFSHKKNRLNRMKHFFFLNIRTRSTFDEGNPYSRCFIGIKSGGTIIVSTRIRCKSVTDSELEMQNFSTTDKKKKSRFANEDKLWRDCLQLNAYAQPQVIQ